MINDAHLARIRLDHRRVKLGEAQAFIAAHHRHAAPLKRHMFSTGVYRAGFAHELIGVSTVDLCSSHAWSMRPDHCELRRVCLVDGAPPNAASYLIGQAVKAVFAIGYTCLITYTRPWESGGSLKASGFYVQKRAAIDVVRGPRGRRLEGGLVQWIRVRGHMPSASERRFTDRVITATNTIWRDESDLLAAGTFKITGDD